MENCHGKAKFTSVEGCAGALAQQAGGAGSRPLFIPDTVGPAPLLELGAQSVRDWLMLHLESGGGVGNNFSVKMELSE
jgi:hypothetical protein